MAHIKTDNYFGYRFRACEESTGEILYPEDLKKLKGIWYEEEPDGNFIQASRKINRKFSDGIVRFGLVNGDWENKRTFLISFSTGYNDRFGNEIWEFDTVRQNGNFASSQKTVRSSNFSFIFRENNGNSFGSVKSNRNNIVLTGINSEFSEEEVICIKTSSEGGVAIGGSATASQGTSADYNQEIVDLAPWYRWTFDDTWNDSGYGTANTPRNGNNVGAVFTTSGGIIPNVSWECGDFTPNDEVRINDSPNINSGTGYSFVKRSISVWANFDNVNSGDQNKGRIVWEQGGGTNWWSIYTYNGSIYSCIGEGRTQDGFCFDAISTSTLYFIVVTIDLSLSSNQMKLYVNGSLVDQTTTSVGSSLASHSGNIAWGGPNSSPRNHLNTTITNNMDGKLADGCYWYEEVLTASEISDIWDAGTSS